MKRAATIAFMLVAGCKSAPDPSTTDTAVASVLVPQASTGGYVGSVVLGTQGQVLVTANDTLNVVSFDPDVALLSPWVAPAGYPEVEIALSGTTVWWAATNGTTSGLWTTSESSFLLPAGNPISFPAGGGDVVGLVADSTAVYAAVSSPEPNDAGAPPPPAVPSPDSWQWPGNTQVDITSAGSLYRIVPGATPSVEPSGATAITFVPGVMQHVLAQSTTHVYWVDSTILGATLGRVMTATKAAWATDPGETVSTLQAMDGVGTGFVGLAANDTYVAWAATPEPPGASGCWVWSSANGAMPTEIFDSDLAQATFACNGLAIDASYAYFTMVELFYPPDDSPVMRGTGVGRVPLAGGPLQTVSLVADRWYGARRLLVDDTFVYAIDPSYVLRFAKDVFGP